MIHLNVLIHEILKKVKKDAGKMELEMEKQTSRKYDNILENPSNKLGRKINTFIIMLILISIFFLIIETVGDNFINYGKYFFIAEGFISIVFAIEYFYRLYTSTNKKRFFSSKLNFVDLISFLPFFLELIFPGLLYAEFLKTLRLFRVFKLLKYNKNIFYIVKSFRNYKTEFSIIGIMIFIVLIFSGFVLYFLEAGVNPGFRNVANSIWWAIVTMATLGYGDVVPITTLGKIFGSIVIILGPIMFAMLSSISILVFMEVAKAKDDEIERKLASKEKVCKRCNHVNPLDANYCMKCGKKYTEKEI